jgi:AraC-like DNA-binding protein
MQARPGREVRHLESACRQDPAARSVTGQRLRFGRGAEGIERLEAALVGEAFSPHRHDTYAVGVTVQGVQTFRYRGELRHCLPGEGHVLHPDETHDGAAGTDEGFGYRIVYVDPALVQEALGGTALPFVADPVIGRRDLPPGLLNCLRDLDEPLGEFERVETGLMIADMLQKHSGERRRRPGPLRLPSLSRVRDLIADDPTVSHPVTEFERITGLDRWTVARQFRAAFGTSPTRYRTMRQLDLVRGMLRAGTPPAEAAALAGFADQSHMTRMFRRTYGLTPARWTAALTRAGHSPPEAFTTAPVT